MRSNRHCNPLALSFKSGWPKPTKRVCEDFSAAFDSAIKPGNDLSKIFLPLTASPPGNNSGETYGNLWQHRSIYVDLISSDNWLSKKHSHGNRLIPPFCRSSSDVFQTRQRDLMVFLMTC